MGGDDGEEGQCQGGIQVSSGAAEDGRFTNSAHAGEEANPVAQDNEQEESGYQGEELFGPGHIAGNGIDQVKQGLDDKLGQFDQAGGTVMLEVKADF